MMRKYPKKKREEDPNLGGLTKYCISPVGVPPPTPNYESPHAG